MHDLTAFIVMRHWNQLKKDGEFWCGTFETDDVDWKLAELIANIQYTCQRHYFGALAETYFDNKDRDAATNVQRRQKTIEAFYRLPEEFTVDDIMRCFGLNYDSARVKASRLQRDHLIVRIDGSDGGPTKAKYKKTATIMI